MLDDTGRKRLLGVAVVFAGAFLLSILLPSPNDGPAPDEAGTMVPLRDPPPVVVVAPLPEATSPALEAETSPVAESEPTPAPAAETTPQAQQAPTRPPAPRPTPPPAAPASQPAPAAAPSGDWWVQAAAYREERIAQHAVGRLQDMGIPSALQRAEVSGQPLWRLRAGPFPSESAAEAARSKLEGEGFVGARLSAP
jgi:cell division protein FtsN